MYEFFWNLVKWCFFNFLNLDSLVTEQNFKKMSNWCTLLCTRATSGSSGTSYLLMLHFPYWGAISWPTTISSYCRSKASAALATRGQSGHQFVSSPSQQHVCSSQSAAGLLSAVCLASTLPTVEQAASTREHVQPPAVVAGAQPPAAVTVSQSFTTQQVPSHLWL